MHCDCNMGTWGAAAGAVATSLASNQGEKKSKSASAPATAPMMPSSSTAVSPTIQTQVSPQISPVFQQTGSGSQTASTSMIAPGGQSGQGGSAMPAPNMPSGDGGGFMPSPYRPNYPTSPSRSLYNDPFVSDFDIARYTLPGSTAGQMIEAQTRPNYAKWGVIGLGLVSATILAYVTMGNKPRRSAPA